MGQECGGFGGSEIERVGGIWARRDLQGRCAKAWRGARCGRNLRERAFQNVTEIDEFVSVLIRNLQKIAKSERFFRGGYFCEVFGGLFCARGKNRTTNGHE